jgi:hypothetical protein
MRNRPGWKYCANRGGVVIDHKLDFSGLLDISRDMELLSKAENKRFCVTAHGPEQKC